MISLQFTFGRAAIGHPRVSTFWLLVLAIAILDDAQHREEKRRKKREREPQQAPKPPAGPRPRPL